MFERLTPDFVLDAVDSCGWKPTGEYLQLNSYENRVFSVRVEEPFGAQVIVKFYRPGRWNESALREEHAFLRELGQQGVSVVAPLPQPLKAGDTLSLHNGFWCAIFSKAKGRMPDEFSDEGLSSLGRVVARLHNVGSQRPARNRPIIDAEHMGWPALSVLEPLLSPDLKTRYLDVAENILEFLDSELDPALFQRIHGDCHRGNVLQTDEAGKPREFFLIDFDDFGMGPVVQDFWMLFRHDEEDFADEIDAFLSGYTELRDFNHEELNLMEPLRGLRIIHYAAWIAKRWSDPSFPQIFPDFGTPGYWLEEVRALEKVASEL